MSRQRAVQPIDSLPYLLTVDEFRRLIGRGGRNATYAAIRRHEIPGVIRVGRKILISRLIIGLWLAGEATTPSEDIGADRRERIGPVKDGRR